jgi:proline iminopeptidase
MRAWLIVGAVCSAAYPSAQARAFQASPKLTAREGDIPVGKGSLHFREIGRGVPIIVLHGGPDFDCGYLVPELDRLADRYRLIYYDQRGRGRSAAQVQPDDVSLASDVDDIDRVRRHFHLSSPVLLGHSWGIVLALEYALRYPANVSRLILMNPAPASAADRGILRTAYLAKLGADMDRQRAIVKTAAYQQGDPETVAARYRIHFQAAFARPADYETVMARMKAGFIRQGSEGILKARAVEDRLMRDSWELDGYDLIPKLRALRLPTLVIYGDRDFIPRDIADHIAGAIPDAQLVTVTDCGHFGYLECPDAVRRPIDDFLRGATRGE